MFSYANENCVDGVNTKSDSSIARADIAGIVLPDTKLSSRLARIQRALHLGEASKCVGLSSR